MSAFDPDSHPSSDLAFGMLVNSPITLFHRLRPLEATINWLETNGYQVVEMDAALWSEQAMHDAFSRHLSFPAYYGRNLDALSDCMRDVVDQSYGWDPAATGFVLVMKNYEGFAANDRRSAQIVLDILAGISREASLVGRCLVCLVQSNDPNIEFEPVGAASVTLNSGDDWVRTQDALWRELAGSTVTRWIGLDTNLGSDDEPIFADASSPYRVLAELRLERGASPALDFTTYQNDDRFGLSLRLSEGRPQPRFGWDRDSDLSDLPTGRIESLEVHLDDSEGSERDLIEVQLMIGARQVLIVAAEVHQTFAEPRLVWGDEDFFVFTDPSAANDVAWSPSRRFVTRQIGPGPDGGD